MPALGPAALEQPSSDSLGEIIISYCLVLILRKLNSSCLKGKGVPDRASLRQLLRLLAHEASLSGTHTLVHIPHARTQALDGGLDHSNHPPQPLAPIVSTRTTGLKVSAPSADDQRLGPC